MFRSIIPVLLAVAAMGPVSAQSSDSSLWHSAYMGGGAFLWQGQSLFQSDFAALAPGSALLAGGLQDHRYSSYPENSAAGLFEAGVGLLPWRNDQRNGPELRLGVFYGGRSSVSGYFYRSDRTPYDTLVSSQTGAVYYVDSVFRSTTNVNYSAERFGLNASLIWRSKGRWSVYGGIGIAGGWLMNARTQVYHYTSSNVSGPVVGEPNGGYFSSVSEQYRNGNGWWLSVYAPIGLDFQITKRNPFWKRMHLYYEFRPQMLFQGTPELGTNTTFGGQSVFGARFTF